LLLIAFVQLMRLVELMAEKRADDEFVLQVGVGIWLAVGMLM
jgi:hypothetical protein